MLVVAAMFGPLALVSTVLGSIRVYLEVRHRSRVSDCLLVDDHGDPHIDQSCLEVSDCKGPKAVGMEVEELVESCGRTCRLIVADKICAGSLLEKYPNLESLWLPIL